MKKTLTLILSLIMILSMVTGCQKVAQASSSAAPSSAGAPAAEGEKKTEGDQKTTEISIPTSNLTGTWYIWGSALSKVCLLYTSRCVSETGFGWRKGSLRFRRGN